MSKILVTGNTTWNTMVYVEQFPDPKPHTAFTKRFHETIGGSGAGKAFNLAKLFSDVTNHALLGDDEHGRKIQKQFVEAGIRFIHDPHPVGTERHINLMNDDGDRISFFLVAPPINPSLDRPRIESEIAQCDYFVANLPDYCRYLLPIAQQHNKPIWIDIHNYDGENSYHHDFIEGATVIQMSSSNLPDYRPFMSHLIESGKEMVVCTHGSGGATLLTSAGEWIEESALSVDVVDTNGAGDSFFSGFLWGIAVGYAPHVALRYAVISGALAVTASDLCNDEMSISRLHTIYQERYGT